MSVTPSPSASPRSTAVSKPNNHEQTVAVASALPLGFMLLGLIAWLLRRRLTTRRARKESENTSAVAEISTSAKTVPDTQLQADNSTMRPSMMGPPTPKEHDVSKPIDFDESPAHEDLPQPTAGSSGVNDPDVDSPNVGSLEVDSSGVNNLDGDNPGIATSSNQDSIWRGMPQTPAGGSDAPPAYHTVVTEPVDWRLLVQGYRSQSPPQWVP
ncbi:hypothetical protein EIP86_001891 [Pleurotus ostreatoroseus]|nr:hypothetical protein EIP86_001891 [Pleurotus ostreatoroseus]